MPSCGLPFLVELVEPVRHRQRELGIVDVEVGLALKRAFSDGDRRLSYFPQNTTHTRIASGADRLIRLDRSPGAARFPASLDRRNRDTLRALALIPVLV